MRPCGVKIRLRCNFGSRGCPVVSIFWGENDAMKKGTGKAISLGYFFDVLDKRQKDSITNMTK